jgi:hypothetical protein
MKFIVAEKKGQREYLQHQEDKKGEVSPNEQKNITHKTIPAFALAGEGDFENE